MINNKNILYKVLFSIIIGFIFFRVEGKTIYNFPTGQQYEYNFPVGQQDVYAYPEGQEPYYNNNDYEVWIRSIINQQDFVFVNLLVKPKRNFRYKGVDKIKKSDRIDFLSSYTLRIIENGNENTENFLPYTGMDHFTLAHYEGKPFYFFGQEYSINLDKNKPDELTLVFRGHLKSTTSNISIIQGDNDKYFEFYDIPVQFPKHDEWEILNKEEDFIQAMQESNNIICGIYKIDGLRFACIPNNNQFYLICLDNSKDYKWQFGDIRGILSQTANPFVFKGLRIGKGYHNSISKDQSYYILNGDILEVKSEDYYKTGELSRYDYCDTFTKIDNGIPHYPINNIEKWSGTGFALKNGYIVTNNHVADGATDIEIFGVKGDFTKGYKAKVIGKDKVSDIALLQIEDPTIISSWTNPPYSVNFSMADVGEDVFALGFPLIGTMGEEVKLTNGIISSRSGFEGDVTNYQISVPIQPGNSGGPMFNEDGELVGIICAKHEGAENAGYAIKTSYLKNLIESVTSTNIVPSNNTLKGKTLKDQVKSIRNNVFLIKCSK